jgi:hypothetical protein
METDTENIFVDWRFASGDEGALQLGSQVKRSSNEQSRKCDQEANIASWDHGFSKAAWMKQPRKDLHDKA